MVLSNASAMIFEKEDVPVGSLEIDLCEKPSSFVFVFLKIAILN